MSSNEQPIKSAIGAYLKSSRLSGKMAEQKIIAGWAKQMGAMIARHTKEISISNKRLYIQLDSAPLRQELFYSREKIIKILNDEAGERVIEEIIFR